MRIGVVGLAARNLLREPRRLIFVGLMTAVGVLAAGVAIGYMSRTFFAIQESTIRSGVGHLQIATAAHFGGYEEKPLATALTPADVARISTVAKKDPRVRQVLPRLLFNGLASSGDRSIVFIGVGVDPLGERRLAGFAANLVAGEGLESGDRADPYRAVIGVEMARILGVKPGDMITLVAATVTGALNAIDVKVVGTRSSGIVELDRTSMTVPLGLAQELLVTDRVSRLVVMLNETHTTISARDDLAAALPQFDVRNWRQIAPLFDQLWDLYARQFSVLGLILALMIALPVANMTALSVTERTRDIGTMRAFGIRGRAIRGIFMVEGFLAALAGGALGAVATWAAAMGLTALRIEMPPPPNQTQGYPLSIGFEPLAVAACVAAVAVIGVAAAWVSSRRVGQISIVEALRAR